MRSADRARALRRQTAATDDAAAVAQRLTHAQTARRRADVLDDLLADPSTWRYVAVQAAAVRAQHPHGSPASSAFARLASVARDLADLATPTTAGGPSTDPQRPQESPRATVPPAPAPARLDLGERARG